MEIKIEISDEEKERKKGNRKRLITAGLATVATIHAAHSMYQAKEQRANNKKLLKEGEISADQAKRARNKQRLQEAASVGIAALGLKGAYSEWKEAREFNVELREEREKMERHRQKRENRRIKYEQEQRVYGNDGYANSMPNLHSPPPGAPYNSYGGGGRGGGGGVPYSAGPQTHYYDDNPYGSMNSPQPNPDAYPPPPQPQHGGYAPQV